MDRELKLCGHFRHIMYSERGHIVHACCQFYY